MVLQESIKQKELYKMPQSHQLDSSPVKFHNNYVFSATIKLVCNYKNNQLFMEEKNRSSNIS